jgi:hypothetical protein
MRQSRNKLAAVSLTFCASQFLVLFLGAGCATTSLMPTPNLYRHTSENPFAVVPPVFRTNTVDILYLTDRMPDGNTTNGPRYGLRRSLSLAFGIHPIAMGEPITQYFRKWRIIQ